MSAVTRTFNITELVENILSHLPTAQDLAHATQASRHFQTVITKTRDGKILQTLYLRAQDPAETEKLTWVYTEGLGLDLIPYTPWLVSDVEEGKKGLGEYPIVSMNPVLRKAEGRQRQVPFKAELDFAFDVVFLVRCLENAPGLGERFVTQPPMQELQLAFLPRRVSRLRSRQARGNSGQTTISDPDGIRLKHLVAEYRAYIARTPQSTVRVSAGTIEAKKVMVESCCWVKQAKGEKVAESQMVVGV